MARRPITRPIFDDIAARADKYVADEDAAVADEARGEDLIEGSAEEAPALSAQTLAEIEAGRAALKAISER